MRIIELVEEMIIAMRDLTKMIKTACNLAAILDGRTITWEDDDEEQEL